MLSFRYQLLPGVQLLPVPTTQNYVDYRHGHVNGITRKYNWRCVSLSVVDTQANAYIKSMISNEGAPDRHETAGVSKSSKNLNTYMHSVQAAVTCDMLACVRSQEGAYKLANKLLEQQLASLGSIAASGSRCSKSISSIWTFQVLFGPSSTPKAHFADEMKVHTLSVAGKQSTLERIILGASDQTKQLRTAVR